MESYFAHPTSIVDEGCPIGDCGQANMAWWKSS